MNDPLQDIKGLSVNNLDEVICSKRLGQDQILTPKQGNFHWLL